LTSLRDFAEQILPHLDALERPRALLGTGIGGSLALELLQRYPEQVDRLILHAPVGAHLDRRRFPKLMKAPGVGWLAQTLIGSPLLRPFWRRLFFETPLEEAFVKEFFEGYRRCQVFSQMFDLITHSWWCGLQPVTVPTVILWGGRERLLSPDQGSPFAQLLPNSRLEILPHWRHFPMIEQPLEFVRKVEEAL
jgi:pimeloyl-ACP methyl ester carboxylesterase